MIVIICVASIILNVFLIQRIRHEREFKNYYIDLYERAKKLYVIIDMLKTTK